jgi:drug/metabolite transporter (DMT)-like permease
MKVIYIFLTLVIAFLSGILPVIHKHLLKKFKPMSVLIFSGLMYSLVLFLFTWTQLDSLKADFAKLDRNDALMISFAAVICVFCSNVLYYTILQNHKSYLVSAIIDSAPLFTLIFASLLLKERITKIGVLGVFFVIMGVGFISINDSNIQEFETPI